MTETVRQIQLKWLDEMRISRNQLSKKLKCNSRAIYNYFNRVKKVDGLTERAIHESINNIIIKYRHESLQNKRQVNG